MSMTRSRRDKIRELIVSRIIKTQKELAVFLRKAGFDATQSSVSRDIARLGLVKKGGRYILPEDLAPNAPLPVRLVEVWPAESFAVLRVLPGQAQILALHLDRLEWPEIVGTVAGDDTVMVACRNPSARSTLIKKLREGKHKK